MTQAEDVVEYIKKHGSITALEGFTKLWIVDLAGVICDLKKKYDVKSTWVYGVNHRGEPVRWKKYRITEFEKESLFDKIRKMI